MNEQSTNSAAPEKIDLISILNDFLRRLRQMWWLVVLLTIGGAALMYYRSSTSYSPSYVAEATVSVEIVSGGRISNRNTAEQMGNIFPYILTSGALSDVIAADLGMSSVPGSIRVSNISGTNLLTITVTSSNADNAYKTLQSVLENYPEVAQYVVGQTSLTVIDESGIPEDTGRTSVIRGSMLRGAGIGFVLSMIVTLVSAMSLRTIRTESELRSLLNVPCLGTLPVCRKKQRRKVSRSEINILNDVNRSDYIEALRLIRTRLERQLGEKKVLMVTSSISGEGKSTVAANLAISMALKGKRVALIDCDLRSPTLHKIFGLKKKLPGLVAVLQGKCALKDTLYEVEKHGMPIGLTLLPGGENESKLVEILGSDAMRGVIETLREQADIVILDTPPSAILVDAMMLVRYVEAIVYVVMSDFARRRYIYKGVEELSVGDAPVVGCILNGGKVRSGGYGYYGYRSRYYGNGYGSGSGKKHSRPGTSGGKSGTSASGRVPGENGPARTQQYP